MKTSILKKITLSLGIVFLLLFLDSILPYSVTHFWKEIPPTACNVSPLCGYMIYFFFLSILCFVLFGIFAKREKDAKLTQAESTEQESISKSKDVYKKKAERWSYGITVGLAISAIALFVPMGGLFSHTMTLWQYFNNSFMAVMADAVGTLNIFMFKSIFFAGLIIAAFSFLMWASFSKNK